MFAPKTKILVVDDFPAMRYLIRHALAELDLENVVEAEDGQQALALIEASQTPFDLIISDWNMPHLLGIDLLRKVRQNPITRETPFVIVTSETRPFAAQEATDAGVSGFLAKPFTPIEFAETLRECFRRHFP